MAFDLPRKAQRSHGGQWRPDIVDSVPERAGPRPEFHSNGPGWISRGKAGGFEGDAGRPGSKGASWPRRQGAPSRPGRRAGIRAAGPMGREMPVGGQRTGPIYGGPRRPGLLVEPVISMSIYPTTPRKYTTACTILAPGGIWPEGRAAAGRHLGRPRDHWPVPRAERKEIQASWDAAWL